MLDKALLEGLSEKEALCYFAPHMGCSYRGLSVNSHHVKSGARCAACGDLATQAHHEPPRGLGGGKSNYKGQMPALIALCTGCHLERHSGLLRFEWNLYEPELAEEIITGAIGAEPHSRDMFEFGYWNVIRDGKSYKEIMNYADW